MSADKKVIKIWDRDQSSIGKILTNIETPADINSILQVSDTRGPSGLLFVAGEQSRVMTYFVPQLGPAPRWCSFLEGITEELEEAKSTTVYEDYKFITAAEVEELGASGLIGTPMLKGYMHGFFIEVGLYTKLRAVCKPFEYEEHRKKRIQDKINEKRASRITALKRLPKVNRMLAEKLLKKNKIMTGEDDTNTNPNKDLNNIDSKGVSKSLIDDRFTALFQREEFEQDIESYDYKLRNPSNGLNKQKNNKKYDSDDDELNNNYDDEMYAPVKLNVQDGGTSYSDEEDDDMDDIGGLEEEEEDGDEDSFDSDLEPIRGDVEVEEGRSKRNANTSRREKSTVRRTSAEEEEGEIMRTTKRMLAKKGNNKERRHTPRMFELSDAASSASAVFGNKNINQRQDKFSRNLPLNERMKSTQSNTNQSRSTINSSKSLSNSTSHNKSSDGIIRKMSYVPKNTENNSRMGKRTTLQSDGVDRSFPKQKKSRRTAR